MNERELREALCEVGRRVWVRNYVASNDGNFSCRLGSDRFLATPTRMSKGFLTHDDLVVVDWNGVKISGHKNTTSEIKLHLHVYRHRPEVGAIVHVHPLSATAFCVARRQLPKCILPEVEVFLGQIPMAPYATPGSEEFARSIDPYLEKHWIFLLTNHGALALGEDIFDAYYKMETLENYCSILLMAKQIGDWNTLDYRSMADLLQIKERLGIPDPRSPESLATLCTSGVAATGAETCSASGNGGTSPSLAAFPPEQRSHPSTEGRESQARHREETIDRVGKIVREVLAERGLI